MNLTLSPAVQKLIDERIASGAYRSAEEVVAAALASLEQAERLLAIPAEEVDASSAQWRQRIADGLAEARAGRLSDGEAFFDELEREEQASDRGRKTA